VHTLILEVNSLAWMLIIPYCHCCRCSITDDLNSSSQALLLSHFISTVKILATFRLGVVLFVIVSVFSSSLVVLNSLSQVAICHIITVTGVLS
jgi:hypothetical protein